MADPVIAPSRRARLLSSAFLVLLFLLICCGVWLVVRPFIGVLAGAAILAVAFYPAYAAIERRVKRPALASLLCVLGLLVLILAPLGLLGTVVVHEGRAVYENLQQESVRQGGWSSYLQSLADRPTAWVAQKTGIPAENLRAPLAEKITTLSGAVLRFTGALFGNLTTTLADLLLTLFVLYFLFQFGEWLGDHLAEYLPIEPERLDVMLETMKTAIAVNLYGMAAVAAAQGLLLGLGFAIAGLPSSVFWGLVGALASLIPLVGTALIWVPGVIVLLAAGSYGKAVFLLVWCIVLVTMSDNVIRPLILRQGMQMNTLAVFIALMGGVNAFGFVGLFAGPVIFTLAYVMFRMLHEERLRWEGRAAPPEAAPEGSAAPPG